MNLVTLIIQDPVVWGSLLVIAATCGLAIYYTYLFLRTEINDNPGEKKS